MKLNGIEIVGFVKGPKKVIEQAIKEGYQLHFPEKPFQAGYICKLVKDLGSAIKAYGWSRPEAGDGKLLLSVCGGTYDLLKLRLHLQKKCGISSPDNMTLREIMTCLKMSPADDKQVPWKDKTTKYLSCKEIIKKYPNLDFNYNKLNDLSKKGDVRYMRKGRRCKIHIDDFEASEYCGVDPFELLDEYKDEINRIQSKIRQEKQK